MTIATRVPLPSCSVSQMRACVRRSDRGLAAVSVLTLRTVARRPQKMSRLPVELAVDDEHVGTGPAAATIRTSRTVPRGHACPRSRARHAEQELAGHWLSSAYPPLHGIEPRGRALPVGDVRQAALDAGARGRPVAVNGTGHYRTQSLSAAASRGGVDPVWAKGRGGPGRLRATATGRPPRDWSGADHRGPARRAGSSRSGSSSREWPLVERAHGSARLPGGGCSSSFVRRGVRPPRRHHDFRARMRESRSARDCPR